MGGADHDGERHTGSTALADELIDALAMAISSLGLFAVADPAADGSHGQRVPTSPAVGP